MKLKANRLFTWISVFWQWLKEGRILILCVLVLVAAGLIIFNTWFSEAAIFWTGSILQLFGMALAIRCLLRIRTHFGQEPLRKLLVIWFRQFPKWNRGQVVAVKGISSCAAMGTPHLQIWTNDDPSQPIEKRINGIVSNLERIRSEQSTHAKSIDSLSSGLEKLQKHEAAEREKLEKGIHADLEVLHTSDLATSIVGLVWISVGIALSAMATELGKWVQ